MSSPIHHAKDLDAALMYAPPWVRDQAPPQPLATVPAVESQQLNEPAGRAVGSFSGDRAIVELQRKLALDPSAIPEPPATDSDQSMRRLALRVGAVIGVAALAAWGLVSLPNTRQTGTETVQAGFQATPISINRGRPHVAPATPVRLVVRDAQGEANTALPAGIVLEGDPTNATIVLSGLAANTRLSAGNAVGATGWRVTKADLDGLLINAPRAFVGTMDVAVELQLVADRVADRQVLHLAWTQPAEAPPASLQSAAPQSSDTALQLDPGEIATLLKRGQEFLTDGDFSSARLLLRRAAEAGNASAALALGATFDPVVIRKLGAVGAASDPARARKWYQKAAELGSNVASQRLETLAQAGQ